MRRRDALGSGDRGHDAARVGVRAQYVAMLSMLNYRAADDIHPPEDTDPSFGATRPNRAGPNSPAGTVPNGTAGATTRNDRSSVAGADPNRACRHDSVRRAGPDPARPSGIVRHCA